MPKEVKLISLKLQLGIGRTGALVTTVGSHAHQATPSSFKVPAFISSYGHDPVGYARVSTSIWV